MSKKSRPNSLFSLFISTLIASVPTFAATGAVTALIVMTSHAEENLGEKVEEKAGEVKKDAKAVGRKMKKKVRDVNCTSERKMNGECGVVPDAKDALNNAGDNIEHGAKKVKNKVD